ncbi:hypothetical protein SBDP1_1020029 [Syntrophobacter sp. SbD1]|nr:hypothetical protein SBDP1_1020029 [Syntrophobacter sp. SbD1]
MPTDDWQRRTLFLCYFLDDDEYGLLPEDLDELEDDVM